KVAPALSKRRCPGHPRQAALALPPKGAIVRRCCAGRGPRMSNREALLRAVVGHPEDDLPRLALADWLEEHGGPAECARAAFIRVQCELARSGGDDARLAELRAQEARLLREHRAEWEAEIPPWARQTG